MYQQKNLILLSLIFFLFLPISAYSLTMLPDPLTDIPGYEGPYDSLATKYEDFWVYSALLNTEMGFLGFDYATGTGKLDVIIYTGSSGVNNQGVGHGGNFNFEDPVVDKGGGSGSFSGWWGQNDQNNDGTPDNVNGPVLVDNMFAYLQSFGPNIKIPVYIFDLNQSQNDPNLQIVGRAYIYDPSTNSTIKEWIFDNVTDGNYNPTDWITAYGEFSMYPYPYNVDHNKGSGKADFIAYAPDMDLSLYTGKGYYFVNEFRMQGLNDGFEELFISGNFYPIPEPSTMILLTSGLLGIGVFFRKRIK